MQRVGMEERHYYQGRRRGTHAGCTLTDRPVEEASHSNAASNTRCTSPSTPLRRAEPWPLSPPGPGPIYGFGLRGH